MMYKSTLFTMLFSLGLVLNLQAQDPYFSQFYAAPQQLNPAMTGVFEGQFRLALNYREQWNSILDDAPYRTMNAGFDYRYRVMRNDYISFGLNVLSDEVGISNFKQQRANLGFAYMKQMSGGRYRTADQYLIIGAQGGIGQHRFEPDDLWFTSQFDVGDAVVNTDLPSGETFNMVQTPVYVDANIGLLWYALFDDNMSIYAGGSINHINSPNISFLDDADEVLPLKWVAHVGGELPFNDNLSILPALAVMHQGPSLNSLFGANFRYTNRDWREVAIRAGLWGQLSNKLENSVNVPHMIFTAILEMEKIQLGISYDINTNITPATNSRGGFELSLIYVQPEKRRRAKIKCPNF